MLLQVIGLRGTMKSLDLTNKMYNSYKLTFLAPRETLYHPTVKIIMVTKAAHLSCHYFCFKNVACNCVLKHHWQSHFKGRSRVHIIHTNVYLLLFSFTIYIAPSLLSQDMIWMVQGPDSVTRWVVAVINDKWYQIIIILPTGKLFPLARYFHYTVISTKWQSKHPQKRFWNNSSFFLMFKKVCFLIFSTPSRGFVTRRARSKLCID